MAISRKPFAALNVTQLQAKISELSDVVKTTTDGKEVNIEELRSAVVAKNDPILTSTFERLDKEFMRSTGLEGNMFVRRLPLPSKDVKSVMQMLIDAKQAVSDFDKDGDGTLNREEILETRFNPRASAGESIADSAAYASRLGFEENMEALLSTPHNKGESAQRKAAYTHLRHLVGACAESPAGEAAMTAHLQNILFEEPNQSASGAHGKMLKVIRKEEESFFKRVFGTPNLNDKEVASLVGRDDLEAYASETKANFREKHGSSFEEIWLDGQDTRKLDVLYAHFKDNFGGRS